MLSVTWLPSPKSLPAVPEKLGDVRVVAEPGPGLVTVGAGAVPVASIVNESPVSSQLTSAGLEKAKKIEAPEGTLAEVEKEVGLLVLVSRGVTVPFESSSRVQVVL